MQLSKVKQEDHHQLSDLEIVKKIQEKGERDLLEIIYDRYAPKIYYKCLSIIRNKDTAKDLAHDIMIKVFLNLSEFRGTAGFASWVYAITYNHCMDYVRKSKRMPVEPMDSKEYDLLSTEEIELENKILKDLKLTQLETILEGLKPGDKLILMMRYQDSMSTKQIAKTLNLSGSAVKMRLKRSRDKLAQQLKDIQNDEG